MRSRPPARDSRPATGRFRRLAGVGGARAAALLAAVLWLCGGVRAQTVDPGLPGSLPVRSLGPGGAGGAIADLEVDPGDRNRLFVGAATGGLWRSANGGTTWEAVFDRAPVQAIGAVAVSPADPDVVWVGTGTAGRGPDDPVGLGAFRSEDGGESWRRLGLAATEGIGRLLPHPHDPDLAWAAVPGATGEEDVRRGVFRTGDGGATWQKVLFVDGRTGAVDLALDPDDPDRLLAAVRRLGGAAEGVGPAPERGGLFLSEDGGRSWQRLGADSGLPAQAGGVAVRFAPSRPDVVYGLTETDGRLAVYRSADGGRRWSATGAGGLEDPEAGVAGAGLRVDPRDESRIYLLGRSLRVSRDGGASFEAPDGELSARVRDLWIDPSDPGHVVAATDRGLFVSRDRGAAWRRVSGLSLAPIRSVSVDRALPFGVYAAAGEAGAWRRPSGLWRGRGGRDAGWIRLGPGEARRILVDPRDSRFVYTADRDGDLIRIDRRTGERKRVDAWAPRGVELRFARSVPMAFDPFRPEMIYAGSQFVHRTSDRGETWQVISGDLSGEDGPTGDGTADPGTVSSIAPSPVQEEVVWVGTDDGRLHLTRSSGGTWTELTDRLPGRTGPGTRVSHVRASRHRGGAAFVSVDRSGTGDRGGYLYRTDDYGRSWERLGSDGALPGIVHTVEQDPLAPALLFAGTSRGLHVSFSGGARWLPVAPALPPVPIRAVRVHPRDYDLVIGTDGRGVHVLDDVRPLRALARDPGLLARPLHLFRPPPAYLRHGSAAAGSVPGDDHRFRGERRPYGALLTYHVGGGGGVGALELEVADGDGEVVRRAEVPGSPGLHRVSWNLGTDLPGGAREVAGRPGAGSPLVPVLPGRYTVRLRGEGVGPVEETVRVLPDPRSEVSPESRRAKREALLEAVGLGRTPRQARERLAELESAVFRVLGPLDERQDAAADTLRERGRELRRRAGTLEREAAEAARRHRRLLESLSSSFAAPTETQRIELQELADEAAGLAERVNEVLLGRVSLFNDRLRDAGLEPLPEFDEVGR